MITIEFRGKCIETNEWLCGDLVHDTEGGCYVYPIDCGGLWKNNKVYPETVGQFTGMCDQHGGKIYEGDIVQYMSLKLIVAWDEKTCAFVMENNDLSIPLINERIHVISVIGDIHDTPGVYPGVIR